MAIRGAEYAVRRIVSILQAGLPAELDLIETEEAADPLPSGLDDVPAGAYFEFEHDATAVEHPISIVVNVNGSEVIQEDSTSNSPGRMWQEHSVEVAFHLKDVDNEEPRLTKKRMLRYVRGIERVLAVRNPTLPSGGVGQVFRIRRVDAGRSTYIDPQDQTGEMGRSARIPFIVTTVENL